ncbi:MAG: hypothetical protein GX316_05645 [Firmicutes bacterium]|nr:hypothetical protein [Bacillota bacterium]
MATVLEFKQMFGVVYELKGQMISASTSILLLLATAAVFFGLGVRRVFKQNFS